jgi:hypothetical protein
MASHEDKYVTRLLLGFGGIIAGVMAILYACFERMKYDDWYFWGAAASFLFCYGVYTLLQAFVHKIKADFSRRQRVRQMQKTDTELHP